MSHGSEWDHGICAMEVKGEGESLSSEAAPLERFPCFTQAHSANLKKPSMPLQKQGMKEERELLGKGPGGGGVREWE